MRLTEVASSLRCAVRFGLVALVLAIGSFGSGTTPGAEVPWPQGGDQPYFKIAQNQPLADLLREFAADQGLPIAISETVTATLSGQFGPMRPQEFLDRITQANGLVWYFDGNAIYVYRSDELQSSMVQLASANVEDVLDKLQRLGLVSARYPIRALPENGLVFLNGPPRYVEIVQGAIESIDASTETRSRVEIAVEVFPLQHAWADDQPLLLNGQQIIMPGVATLLRNLVTGQQTEGLQGRLGPLPNFNLPGLRGQGLAYRENLAVAQQEQAAVNAEVAAAEARARVDAFEAAAQRAAAADGQLAAAEEQMVAVIQADQRLNAVVIRDAKSRMPYFREVIRALDQPSGLVQIEAHIIDVDANAGFEFGLPYRAAWQSGADSREFNASLNDLDEANFTLSFTENGVVQFLTQLRALETDGRARFVSRPSVLTLNNTEAQLDSTSTFFVRIAGQFEVDLFDVTVGTTLRIVPHIICEQTGRRIKLITRIEDGRATDERVDLIPVIDRNTINTQAVINEGESLLIGGLIREEVTKIESRVPVLGRIPYVGHAFSSVRSQKQKFERLVLIRPRIVDLPCPGGVEQGLLPPLDGGLQVCPTLPPAIQLADEPLARPEPLPLPPAVEPSPQALPPVHDGAWPVLP
jgi:type III secretion protein C